MDSVCNGVNEAYYKVSHIARVISLMTSIPFYIYIYYHVILELLPSGDVTLPLIPI